MSETEAGLSELPDGWVWTTLEEVSELNPRIDRQSIDDDLEVTFLPMKSVEELSGKIDLSETKRFSELKRKNYTPFRDGDILFAKVTPCMENGKIAIAHDLENGIGFGSTEFHVIRLSEEQSTQFFFFYFLQQKFRQEAKRAMTSGVGLLRVPTDYMRRVLLPLPPLSEQHCIVAKIEELFTKLDAGINALHKAQSQLKRYRQSVLKAAFEGKLTEVWRADHQDEIEPASSIVNDLPDGWTPITVGKIAQKIHYGYTESATNDPIGPKFLRITDIQNNSVNWDSVPYCQIDEIKQQQYLLSENDLVFARTGATVGKSFLIQGSIPDTVFASYLIRIVLKKEINAKFVYTFFQSQSYWKQIHQGKVGSGQPNVNAKILSQITLPLPSLSEQQAIVSEVESRLSVADKVEKTITAELKRAEQLRQSILKKAFSGNWCRKTQTMSLPVSLNLRQESGIKDNL